MPTHNGRKVFRPQGRPQDYSTDDWASYARKAVRSGGRVVQGNGEVHLVSPSGSHWGTFKTQQGVYEGATLKKLDTDSDLRDITDQFS